MSASSVVLRVFLKSWRELWKGSGSVGKILGGAEDLSQARQSRGLSISQGFKRVKSHVASLHEAIGKSWTCACQDEHVFKLLLGDRAKQIPSEPETGSRAFRVAFPLRHHLWTKPHTLIHQKDAWCTTDTTMVPLAECQQTSPKRDTIEESTIYSDSDFTVSLSTATTALTTHSHSSTCLDSGERKPSLDSNQASRLRLVNVKSSWKTRTNQGPLDAIYLPCATEYLEIKAARSLHDEFEWRLGIIATSAVYYVCNSRSAEIAKENGGNYYSKPC